MIVVNLECPCPKKGCPNQGKCEECHTYHLASKRIPFCEREHGLITKLFYRKNYQMIQTLKGEGKL